LRAKLSYANVMATLAVGLALAGGGTAIALSAAKNSVTSSSIRAGNVAASDLAGVRVVRAETSVGPTEGSITARCAKGERAVGGGAIVVSGDAVITGSSISANGWMARGRSAVGLSPLRAEALCLRAKASKPLTRP
jgi:hypothetical protein